MLNIIVLNPINLPKHLKTIIKCDFFTFIYMSSAKETDAGLT